MKKLCFILFIFSFTVTVSSCKKKGCTDPTATNYDSNAKKDDGTCIPPIATPNNPNNPNNPTTSLLCDGIAGSNSYYPVDLGYLWRWDGTNGFPTLYSDSIIGTVSEDGFVWFDVLRKDETAGGSNSSRRLRIEAGTNNVILKASPVATPEIAMFGTPAIGQTVFTNYVITSLNASYSNTNCSYTNCIEASWTTQFGISKIYFKKGIGRVGYTSAFGNEKLIKFHN